MIFLLIKTGGTSREARLSNLEERTLTINNVATTVNLLEGGKSRHLKCPRSHEH